MHRIIFCFIFVITKGAPLLPGKKKDMKKVLFYELDCENKLNAASQMFAFNKTHSYPNGALWENEDDILEDLEHGYDPNEHFSFYVDEYNEVETKIG